MARETWSEGPPDEEADEELEVDLHGLRPEKALERLGRELHAARVRRKDSLLVITGRGLGNGRGEPVLRGRVEAWLLGPEGRRLGVRSFERRAKGGALHVRLGAPQAGGGGARG